MYPTVKSIAFFAVLLAATAQAKRIGGDGDLFKLKLTSIKDETEKFTQNTREVLNNEGPTFTINVADTSISKGVGSLNVEGKFQREIVENVDAGIVYKFNENRALPTSVWVSTEQEVGQGVTAHLRADVDVKTKNAVVDCRLSKDRDSVACDFDTSDNTIGPLRITKHFELDGKSVIVQPTLDIQGQTGQVVIAAEVDEDQTSCELTLDHSQDKAALELCHRIDENNVISPKVDLKTGDIAVRLNRQLSEDRAVKVTAMRDNVDWEYYEGAWKVAGNIPLLEDGDSSISFKRSINF